MPTLRKVLIVDDSQLDRAILKALAESENFLPVLADGGVSALMQLKDKFVDFMIVDLTMPNISGVELIKKIRQNENYMDTPIMVASAKNDLTDVKDAIAAGATDYLIKPIDPEIFSAKVSALRKSKEKDWFEYEIDSHDINSAIEVTETRQLVGINEISFSFISPTPYTLGSAVSIKSNIFRSLRLEEVMGRVERCEPQESSYKVYCLYLGMPEKSRQEIRLFCRKIWTRKNESEKKVENKKIYIKSPKNAQGEESV